MALDITIIPTEQSGSLGPDKTDRYPIPDTSDELRSAEWNVAKKAVAQTSAAVGLGDGTTDGSLEQRARRALNAPSASSRWSIVDDFFDPALNLAADARWQAQIVAGATLTGPLGANTDPASLDGFGWAIITVPAAGGASL